MVDKKESEVKIEPLINRPFFNYRNRPPKVKILSKKPSKVQESPMDAKSPQELLSRHGMYNDRSSLKELKPFYADLTQFNSYEESLNNVRDIKEKFMSLDVSIRAKFNHNPEEFCNYINSDNFDIREIMTVDDYKNYNAEIERIKAQQDYEKYIKSDEYKKQIEEEKLKEEFYKEQFEKWRKNRTT